MTIDRSPRRRETGVTVLGVLLLITLVSFALYMGAMWFASAHADSVRAEWEREIGDLDTVLERYPSHGPNDTAIAVEPLAAELGIDIVPRHIENRLRPPGDEREAFKRISPALRERINEIAELEGREPIVFTTELDAYLEEHQEVLERVRRSLIAGPPPRWTQRVEAIFAAPLPNLLGQINLQRILVVDALRHHVAGDRTTALRSLEASWQLSAGTDDSPFLIATLIDISVARSRAAALRQLGELPDVWADRLDGSVYRARFFDNVWMEGWVGSRIDDPADLLDPEQQGGWLRRLGMRVARPYFEYCTAEVNDNFLARARGLVALDARCDDPIDPSLDFQSLASSWNVVEEWVAAPHMLSAFDRLRRLELELELTATLAGFEPPTDRDATSLASQVCAEERWTVEPAGEGRWMLALSRRPKWPRLDDANGVKPPLLARFAWSDSPQQP